MEKRKNMMDMTPVCERCGKVAPVDNKLSTPNWTVYRTKETRPPPTLRRCDMGGGFTMKTVYSLIVNAATQNLTTAIIADYAGQRWMVQPNERAAV